MIDKVVEVLAVLVWIPETLSESVALTETVTVFRPTATALNETGAVRLAVRIATY